MIIIDSSGWIEYFADGPLKRQYEKYMKRPADIVVPAIVCYEVYKKIKTAAGENEALRASKYLFKLTVAPVTESIALTAADFAIEHSLHLADALIYATAFEYGCKVVTSDAHFKDLDNVVYIKK